MRIIKTALVAAIVIVMNGASLLHQNGRTGSGIIRKH